MSPEYHVPLLPHSLFHNERCRWPIHRADSKVIILQINVRLFAFVGRRLSIIGTNLAP